jgi:hypothetical protein
VQPRAYHKERMYGAFRTDRHSPRPGELTGRASDCFFAPREYFLAIQYIGSVISKRPAPDKGNKERRFREVLCFFELTHTNTGEQGWDAHAPLVRGGVLFNRPASELRYLILTASRERTSNKIVM